MISEEALKDFKQAYLEEFGTEISEKEALELSINLLTMFNNTYRPVKEEWVKEITKEENDIQ